jgi:PAS domain S-box-containing protein
MNWKEAAWSAFMQCRLAFAAFLLMVLGSYMTIGFIMEKNLANGASRSLDTVGENINAYFSEADTALSIAAQAVRELVRRGESLEEIRQYLSETTAWLRRHEDAGASMDVSFHGIFGVLRGEFIDSVGLNPKQEEVDAYVPQTRPWYQAAVRGRGKTVFTDPYISRANWNMVITAARELFDDEGNTIGVIALDTRISRFLRNVYSLGGPSGGYGIITNRNLDIMAHADRNKIGASLRDQGGGFPELCDAILSGKSLSAMQIEDADGKPLLVFSKRIANGWHAILPISKSVYYRDMHVAGAMLAGLGGLFALLLSYLLLRQEKARAASEKSLDEKNKLLELVFESAQIGAWEWDASKTTLQFNDMYLKMLGYAPGEISCTVEEWESFVHPEDLSVAKEVLEAATRGDIPGYSVETRLRRKDGRYIRTLDFGGVVERDDDGKAVRIMGGHINLDREMKLLTSLARIRAEEVKLKRERDLAIKNSEAKAAFLVRMSHEIRTPMNAIIGLSELAQREYGKAKALEYIMGIRSAGASLLAIINDILDFSRIESGRMDIAPFPYETASLLNDVLTIIQVRIAETPLELITEIVADTPGVMIGDANRIKQILLNLLNNAVKYTQRGFIKFSVSWERTEGDDIRLMFTVEDSGIGIRQEDIQKLFGEFTRIDEKRNINVEGTGLGLSIARSLSRAMGGDITVCSEYGQGSMFTATLTQTVADWKPMGNMGDLSGTRAETQSVTFIAPEAEVLLVDDFPSNLLVAEGLLVPYRMRLSTCLNGREAVERVEKHAFDLVLMDHMMPEMDGVEATRAIRTLDEERCRTMPIVALTANAVSGMREMFLENGFNDYLSKPIDVRRLDAVLKEWIPAGKRRAPEEDRPLAEAAQFPEIAGLDAAAGMARIGGSPKRYLNLLETFCRDAEAGIALLEKEPQEATLHAFTTLAHALKSALANIGANDLSQSAAALEKAGREADLSAIREKLGWFRGKLIELTAHIGEFLVSARSGESKERVDPEILAALARLREALAAKDFDAMDAALEQAQSRPAGGKMRDALAEIADFVLTAEFEKAADAIHVLLE